jgi:hypothetical protein
VRARALGAREDASGLVGSVGRIRVVKVAVMLVGLERFTVCAGSIRGGDAARDAELGPLGIVVAKLGVRDGDPLDGSERRDRQRASHREARTVEIMERRGLRQRRRGVVPQRP